jgi:hypothetical protein
VIAANRFSDDRHSGARVIKKSLSNKFVAMIGFGAMVLRASREFANENVRDEDAWDTCNEFSAEDGCECVNARRGIAQPSPQ